MATNDVLDRLEAMLAKVKSGPVFNASGMMSTWDVDTYIALRNAAPALIRLARAVLAMDDWHDKDDYTLKLDHDERAAATKAIGEVRL